MAINVDGEGATGAIGQSHDDGDPAATRNVARERQCRCIAIGRARHVICARPQSGLSGAQGIGHASADVEGATRASIGEQVDQQRADLIVRQIDGAAERRDGAGTTATAAAAAATRNQQHSGRARKAQHGGHAQHIATLERICPERTRNHLGNTLNRRSQHTPTQSKHPASGT